MIGAYDEWGNTVDLVEWEKKIRADEYQKIASKYMLLTEKQVEAIRAEAINEFAKWEDSTRINYYEFNTYYEDVVKRYLEEKNADG